MWLRLLGMFETIPLASLRTLVPFIWVCVVIQALSGTLLWLTKPARYLEAGIFDVKLTLVLTGIIVTLYFQKTLKNADSSSPFGTISARAIRYIGAMAFLWAAVLVAGRLTAYFGLYATALPR